ncbi:hypothetical protein Q0Z83_042800 [Actinoplanes sichuanensis]|uniref:Pentapeptide repeat-containing protein n=1 Tax=Actinoplanes sichuanensis TaxID=512349 RepID=A0ABW4AT12_9ACTN|nr:hypothetical protein [Actinoplanes sichuanensis]BEL06089.1 hypothetical protein Q0Z83_042800 [Actinoplanes sichuanensis]
MNHDESPSSLHAGTAADLGRLLDVEAGLREVLIAAQHAGTEQDLDLDVEAGLHAIVPSRTEATPEPAPSSPIQLRRKPDPMPDRPELHSTVAARLMSMDSTSRLALRNHPSVVSVEFTLAISSAKAINDVIVGLLDLELDLGRSSARDVRDRAYALTRDLSSVRATAVGTALAPVFTRNLAFDHVRYLAGDLSNRLRRELISGPVLDPEAAVADLARELAAALIRALDRARDLDHVLGLARDLGHVLDLTPVLGLDLTTYRALHLARLRDLDLARAFDLNLDHDRPRGLARALDHVRVFALFRARSRSRALDRARDLAIAGDLARDFGLDLDHARNDFTTADLSDVDLTGVSLIGVRWSMSNTRWPSEQWRAQALLTSRELGDGTYEIETGTTNVPVHSL